MSLITVLFHAAKLQSIMASAG